MHSIKPNPREFKSIKARNPLHQAKTKGVEKEKKQEIRSQAPNPRECKRHKINKSALAHQNIGSAKQEFNQKPLSSDKKGGMNRALAYRGKGTFGCTRGWGCGIVAEECEGRGMLHEQV